MHWFRCIPCAHSCEPPHALQMLRFFPCSQMPFPLHALQ